VHIEFEDDFELDERDVSSVFLKTHPTNSSTAARVSKSWRGA
jgi:hypothetical protein